MHHIARQLKQVRRTGRLLLVMRRLAQLVAMLGPVLIGLGLLDYALRLPGAMRLLIGLAVLGGIGFWLVARLNRALRFWPSLAELALRAERLYPQLAGSLASAVEFSMQPGGYAEPASTASMARLAVDEMQGKSRGVDVRKMINLMPTLKAGALAVLAFAVVGTMIAAAPQASSTAAQRWLMPLGDTQWPKVNEVEVLTPDDAVFAADGKVRLRARVTRGGYDALRMTISYRVLDEVGEGQWQSVRVARQRNSTDSNEYLYETLLDVPPATARALMAGTRPSATLEVRYSAGDDTTEPQQLTLAARPELHSVVITTRPPDYALGLIGEQRTPLHQQAGRMASTSAYRGSEVTMAVRFNKSIPSKQANAAAQQWTALIGEGYEAFMEVDNGLSRGFKVVWTLDQSVTGSFDLTDEFGLRSTEEGRRYRVQAIEDEPPAVVLLRPALDESVLPGATIQLKAVAEDDVAMQSLKLEVISPDRENTAEDAQAIATRALEDARLLKTGRFETLELDYSLALKPLGLLPGDEVLITAVGQDVFKLQGVGYGEVRSDTRRLRVMTEQELADQVRRVLRGVRNTAQSLERNQRLVAERTQDGEPAETAEQQGDIGRRIASQQDTIDAVKERLQRNEPRDLDGLEQLLERAEGMLDKARASSEQAQERLEQASVEQQAAQDAGKAAESAQQAGDQEQADQQRQAGKQAEAAQKASEAEAGQAQEKSREQLAELVATLDMGESVGEIESELMAIKSDAQRIAQNTRELLPKTVGQKLEDLKPEWLEQLIKNAARQQELAERAEELIDKMRATADEIGENGETPELRATAKTLTEVADIAERQGLEENTQDAAEQLEENQIADAATQQQQAMATLEQMLAEMGKQSQRRQEELKRLLQELAQKIQQLVDEQRDQLTRAEEANAGALAVLEQPQFDLRRRTMLIEAQALQAPDTAVVGKRLSEAVRDQAEAVKAIRVTDKAAAVASEAEALAHLEAALALINEQQQQEQQDQRRQEQFALRQAYYDLADRQAKLAGILSQHEREEAYGRRDWRQINRLYEEALEDRSFDEEQQAVRETSVALGEKAGKAMVYQSLHRRIDQAAGRAEQKLSERAIDGSVLEDQRSVERMLRAMGDALDDTADPDKFENDNEGEQQGAKGGQGEGDEPPLVPDLAEIKLLREVMIVLRNETKAVAEAGDGLTNERRAARLVELAQQQRELKELGEQLVEKLRERMAPAPPEGEGGPGR